MKWWQEWTESGVGPPSLTSPTLTPSDRLFALNSHPIPFNYRSAVILRHSRSSHLIFWLRLCPKTLELNVLRASGLSPPASAITTTAQKEKSRQSGFKPSPFIHSFSLTWPLSDHRYFFSHLPIMTSHLLFTSLFLSTACSKLPRKIFHNKTFITFCLFFKLQIEPHLLTYMPLLSVRRNSQRWWWLFISELMSFISLCWRG